MDYYHLLLLIGTFFLIGQFGRVFSAYLCHAREKIEEHVAVKTMKCKMCSIYFFTRANTCSANKLMTI